MVMHNEKGICVSVQLSYALSSSLRKRFARASSRGHTMGTWGCQLRPHWFLLRRWRSDSMIAHNEKAICNLFNCHRPCPAPLENVLQGPHHGGHTICNWGRQVPPHWLLIRGRRSDSMMVHNEKGISVSVHLS